MALVYLFTTRIDLSPLFLLRTRTIALCLGLLSVSVVAGVPSTWLILKDIGYRTGIWPLFLVLATSYAGNYLAPAKVGIPLRIYLYHSVLGVPISGGVACVVLTNFVWSVCYLLVAVLGLLFISSSIGLASLLALIFIFIGALLALVFVPSSALRSVARRMPGQHLWDRALNFIEAVQVALQKITISSLAFLVLVFMLALLVQGLAVYLILFDIGGTFPLGKVIWTLSISLAIGIVSLLPMGAGTQDASFVFLLIGQGVSQEVAISVALAYRVIFTAIPFLIGVLSANLLGVDLLQRGGETKGPRKREQVP